MEEKSEGLYNKYMVFRRDGTSIPGGKHADCFYYVLDIKHDKFAAPALKAYANACEAEYPLLAQDIRKLFSK